MISFFSKRAKASIMAEVLVSLFILSAGISAGASLITSAIHANMLNKDRLIATNLAREGIEAVRIIRDTNWLRYGEKIRQCWNFWENTNENDAIGDEGDSCETSTEGQNTHPIGMTADETKIQNYIVILDPANFHWFLAENFDLYKDDGSTFQTNAGNPSLGIPANLDDSTWNDRKVKMPGVTSQLFLTSENLYTHLSTGNTLTQFNREIRITYPLSDNGTLNTDDDGFFPKDQMAADNQILVTSTVWYQYKGTYKKVVLQTELTDYLNRDNWLE